MRVMVLGCGPAGLMAFHAAVMGGHDAICVSKNRKSVLKGAQYLHAPIPEATPGDAFTVSYELQGQARGYAEKVYGVAYKGTVSPEELSETHEGWDIRETYDWLWAAYGDAVLPTEGLDPAGIQSHLEWAKADLTISTIPAKTLCSDWKHRFDAQTIWSSEDNTFIPGGLYDNTVICNGQEFPSWYRAAKIQGHVTVEWPYLSKPPLPQHQLWEVSKPIKTDCNCFPEVHRMGRYGKWEKGVLSDSAYYDTEDLLKRGAETLAP